MLEEFKIEIKYLSEKDKPAVDALSQLLMMKESSTKVIQIAEVRADKTTFLI